MSRHEKRRWYSGLEGAARVLTFGVIAIAALCVGFGSFLIGYGWGMR